MRNLLGSYGINGNPLGILWEIIRDMNGILCAPVEIQ